MSDLIIKTVNVTKEIQKLLTSTNRGGMILVEVRVDDMVAVIVEALRILQSSGYSGIYISLSKDFIELSRALHYGGINTESISFLDAISGVYSVVQVNQGNVSYIEGPQHIKKIQTEAMKILKTIPGKKRFILLDSLTTAQLYNPRKQVEGLIKFLQQLSKNYHVFTFAPLVSREKEGDFAVNTLSVSGVEVISLEGV